MAPIILLLSVMRSRGGFDAHVGRVLRPRDSSRRLLMLCALGSTEQALAAWSSWRALDGDAAQPIARRWLPLVANRLPRERVDDASRELLASACRDSWAFNQQTLARAEPIVAACASAGIPVMVLKGAALGATAYPSSAHRLIGDLDLLVRASDAARARALLDDRQWQPIRPLAERDLPFVHGLNYVSPAAGNIDLHWHALRESCAWEADAGFWRRARPLMLIGQSVRALSAADQLLHTCIHGLRWTRVHSAHWIADAVMVLTRQSAEIDWDTFVGEARSRRLMWQARNALGAAAAFAPGAVPPAVWRDLASDARWPDRVELFAKVRPLVSATGPLQIWFDWRRLKRGNPIGPRFEQYLAATLGARSRAGLVRRLAALAHERVMARRAA